MPYYTPPDATPADTLLSRVAAGYVQRYALVPDPEPSDYADMAEAAEYLVFNYLKATRGGTLTAQSRSGLSVSVADFRRVRELVAGVMGPYLTTQTSFSIAVDSSFDTTDVEAI